MTRYKPLGALLGCLASVLTFDFTHIELVVKYILIFFVLLSSILPQYIALCYVFGVW